MKRQKSITSFFSKRVAISNIEDGGKHSSISSMTSLRVKSCTVGDSDSPNATTSIRPLSASVSAPDLPIPGTSGACEDLLLDPPPFNDIGALLVPTKSIEEICQVVGKLSNDQKYSILYHHVSPPNIYPSTYSHGTNRKFGIGLRDIPGYCIAPSWMLSFVGHVFSFLFPRGETKACW